MGIIRDKIWDLIGDFMKKILLIEDDPFLVEIYTIKFKESGFEAEFARSGESALALIKEKKPDLILLDIVMPKIDGFEFLRQVKDDPQTKDIIVVFLTNLGQKEEIEKGLSLGAVDYLVKAHFTPSEVVEKVKTILNRST